MAKKKVFVLVGTHKGAFIFSSDEGRKKWSINGPLLKGADVNEMILDLRGDPTLFACANSYWWGPNVHVSRDFGKTWKQSDSGIKFDEKSGKTVARVWHISPGLKSEPNVLYAGVDPGALFRSDDAGKSWKEIESLTNHPTRQRWTPGAGGLMVHCSCIDPNNAKKMFVGISAAGVFCTEDGGVSWEPRNKGVLADFLPDKHPEVGQCTHHLDFNPSKPNVLYQQNHCGVYRSDNEGKDWIDISEGLPSRFGFPLQVHPHDPDTIYVIPEEGAEFRGPVGGKFGVYRSTNKGGRWKKLTKGLPTRNMYAHVHRQGMAADQCEKSGVYVGTSGGQILFSRNEGDSWHLLADWLPAIYSVRTAVV